MTTWQTRQRLKQEREDAKQAHKDKYPNYQGKKSHAKRRLSANNSSGYAGVSYRLKDATWGASVFYCGKLYNIGQYKTKQQAVEARNKYIITHKMPHKLQLYI